MKRTGKLTLEVVAVLISLIVVVPAWVILVNSFKDKSGAADLGIGLPGKWALFANYKQVFIDAKIPMAFWNTTVITVLGVALLIVVASAAAYVIQRRNNRLTAAMSYVLLAGMLLPGSVITTYLLMDALHLVRTYAGVIMLHAAGNFAFITYLYIGYFHGIPRELDEAAIIDGAGKYRLFYNIIFPLLLPINATVTIIAAMTIWNDFFNSFYFLNTPTRFTLSLTVYFFFGQHASDWNLVFADIMIISLPVIVLYIFLQRFIVSGLTAGAVKS